MPASLDAQLLQCASTRPVTQFLAPAKALLLSPHSSQAPAYSIKEANDLKDIPRVPGIAPIAKSALFARFRRPPFCRPAVTLLRIRDVTTLPSWANITSSFPAREQRPEPCSHTLVMELSILASTASASASAQASNQPIHSPSGTGLSADRQQHYYYPSPPKDTAVRCGPYNSDNIMTAASPANGAAAPSASLNNAAASPVAAATPKSVAFELLFPESPQYRARLPLRVSIFPHDTTDSIVTTVKNFYGLYSGPTVSKGVSFEDDKGNTLIARYENFRNNMIVYVRVIEEASPAPGTFGPQPYHPAPFAAQALYNGDGYQPQPHHHAQHSSRPASRSSRHRSLSPNTHGRRSASASANPAQPRKGGPSSSKNLPANYDTYSDSMNGYSSGDGAASTSSGKTKEHLGNTEISVENIVEGGRRKRAKFESSVSSSSTFKIPVREQLERLTGCTSTN